MLINNKYIKHAIKMLLIFVPFSINSMTAEKNIALATPSLNGVGTEHTFGVNKGIPICGIYKITSPSKRIYIGQSIDCKRREKQYVRGLGKKQWLLYNSIKKYGWDKHTFEIIDYCLPEELNDKEIYYIELFKCFNSEHGLNLKSGGDNKIKFSDISIEKMRDKLIGNKYCVGRIPWNKGKTNYCSPETIKKMKESKLGNKNHLGHIAWNKGLTRETDERVDRIAKNHIGKTYGVMKRKNKPASDESPK